MPLSHLSARLSRRLALYRQRRRTRRQLSRLDDHMLRDIGLSRYDVVRESRKPFWQD
ncbi:DUF1127 domain-containing protein [Halomonas sp. WWR20]